MEGAGSGGGQQAGRGPLHEDFINAISLSLATRLGIQIVVTEGPESRGHPSTAFVSGNHVVNNLQGATSATAFKDHLGALVDASAGSDTHTLQESQGLTALAAAVRKVHHEKFDAYRSWLEKVHLQPAPHLVAPKGGLSVERLLLELVELVLLQLLYDEAANLRHAPELLWFIYYVVTHSMQMVQVLSHIRSWGLFTGTEQGLGEQLLRRPAGASGSHDSSFAMRFLCLHQEAETQERAARALQERQGRSRSYNMRAANAEVRGELAPALTPQEEAFRALLCQLCGDNAVLAAARRACKRVKRPEAPSSSFQTLVFQGPYHALSEQVYEMGRKQGLEAAVRVAYDDMRACMSHKGIVHNTLKLLSDVEAAKKAKEVCQAAAARTGSGVEEAGQDSRYWLDGIMGLGAPGGGEGQAGCPTGIPWSGAMLEHRDELQSKLRTATEGEPKEVVAWRRSTTAAEWWQRNVLRKTYAEHRTMAAGLLAFSAKWQLQLVWFYLLAATCWAPADDRLWWLAGAVPVHWGSVCIKRTLVLLLGFGVSMRRCQQVPGQEQEQEEEAWWRRCCRWVWPWGANRRSSNDVTVPTYCGNIRACLGVAPTYLHSWWWFAVQLLAVALSWALLVAMVYVMGERVVPLAASWRQALYTHVLGDEHMDEAVQWSVIGLYSAYFLLYNVLYKHAFVCGYVRPSLVDWAASLFDRGTASVYGPSGMFPRCALATGPVPLLVNALLWCGALALKFVLDWFVLIRPALPTLRAALDHAKLGAVMAALQVLLLFLLSDMLTATSYALATAVFGALQGVAQGLGRVRGWRNVCAIFHRSMEAMVHKLQPREVAQEEFGEAGVEGDDGQNRQGQFRGLTELRRKEALRARAAPIWNATVNDKRGRDLIDTKMAAKMSYTRVRMRSQAAMATTLKPVSTTPPPAPSASLARGATHRRRDSQLSGTSAMGMLSRIVSGLAPATTAANAATAADMACVDGTCTVEMQSLKGAADAPDSAPAVGLPPAPGSASGWLTPLSGALGTLSRSASRRANQFAGSSAAAAGVAGGDIEAPSPRATLPHQQAAPADDYYAGLHPLRQVPEEGAGGRGLQGGDEEMLQWAWLPPVSICVAKIPRMVAHNSASSAQLDVLEEAHGMLLQLLMAANVLPLADLQASLNDTTPQLADAAGKAHFLGLVAETFAPERFKGSLRPSVSRKQQAVRRRVLDGVVLVVRALKAAAALFKQQQEAATLDSDAAAAAQDRAVQVLMEALLQTAQHMLQMSDLPQDVRVVLHEATVACQRQDDADAGDGGLKAHFERAAVRRFVVLSLKDVATGRTDAHGAGARLPPIDDFFTVAGWLEAILAPTDADSAPTSREAVEQVCDFLNGLHHPHLPDAPRVAAMRSVTTLVPHYAEPVLFALSSEDVRRSMRRLGLGPPGGLQGEVPETEVLFRKDGSRSQTFHYLVTEFGDELRNLLQRMETIRPLGSGEGPYWEADFLEGGRLYEWRAELLLWASFRGQTLARTVDGMCKHYSALVLQGAQEALRGSELRDAARGCGQAVDGGGEQQGTASGGSGSDRYAFPDLFSHLDVYLDRQSRERVRDILTDPGLSVEQMVGQLVAEVPSLERLATSKYSLLVSSQCYTAMATSTKLEERWRAYGVQLLATRYPPLRVACLESGQGFELFRAPNFTYKVACQHSKLMRTAPLHHPRRVAPASADAASSSAAPAAAGQAAYAHAAAAWTQRQHLWGLAAAPLEVVYRQCQPLNYYDPEGKGVGIILGEGKPENQNSALPYAHGQLLQTIDMNQDANLAQALKLRSVTREFDAPAVRHRRHRAAAAQARAQGRCRWLSCGMLAGRCGGGSDGGANDDDGTADYDGPYKLQQQVAVVGYPETIFSFRCGLLAELAAATERTFGTQLQRVMAFPSRVRCHYGHPDLWNLGFVMMRGGISKPNAQQHVSEDVFGGFNALLSGGMSLYVSYYSVAKGRDMGLVSILGFEGKISKGFGEMLMSRELRLLGEGTDFFRSLSLYMTGPGHFINTALTVATIELGAWLMAMMLMAGAAGQAASVASAIGSVQVLQLGALPLLGSLFNLWLEHGLASALYTLMRQIIGGGMMFHIFRSFTTAFSATRSALFGGAGYVATGRGFSLVRSSFTQVYAVFGRSHMLPGGALLVLTLLTLLVANTGGASSAHVPLIALWSPLLVAASLLIGPFWFTPFFFRLKLVLKDLRDFKSWLKPDGQMPAGMDKKWEQWNEQECSALRNDAGTQVPGYRAGSVACLLVPRLVGCCVAVYLAGSFARFHAPLPDWLWAVGGSLATLALALAWAAFNRRYDNAGLAPHWRWARMGVQVLTLVLVVLLIGAIASSQYGGARLCGVLVTLYADYQVLALLATGCMLLLPSLQAARRLTDSCLWQADSLLGTVVLYVLIVLCVVGEIGLIMVEKVQLLVAINDRFAQDAANRPLDETTPLLAAAAPAPAAVAGQDCQCGHCQHWRRQQQQQQGQAHV